MKAHMFTRGELMKSQSNFIPDSGSQNIILFQEQLDLPLRALTGYY